MSIYQKHFSKEELSHPGMPKFFQVASQMQLSDSRSFVREKWLWFSLGYSHGEEWGS